jgi:hypothetical protein
MADFLREGGVTRLDRLDDGRVMCCICMEFKKRDELQPVAYEPGRLWDMCQPCWALENPVEIR